MRVQKRDGSLEDISFDKILERLRKLATGLAAVNVVEIGMKVVNMLHDAVKTSMLDEYAAELCASLMATHPEYGTLASRLLVSNLHKNTPAGFLECAEALRGNRDAAGVASPLVSARLLQLARSHTSIIQGAIDYERDFDFDFFGLRTLERGYMLQSSDGVTVERPQHMFMRVALGIHDDDLDRTIETYRMLSAKMMTHASPTLYNAGTPTPQLSSCFLLRMFDDSIDGIYDTLKACAKISKHAGGVGLNVHNVRASGSLIRGTNGRSTGLVPMLRAFNATARYVNQGGKRFGSFAIYLEPWHADVEAWLELRKNHGTEEERARDLFYGLWVPDLFMRRVQAGAEWSLMCPDECPGLADAYGPAFDALYERYEAEGRFRKRVDAAKLWHAIVRSQIETGTPYLCYKDAVNSKNQQANLGVIRSSNLCTEIMEYSGPDEVAVCNLLSICLPAFVRGEGPDGPAGFDYTLLHAAAKVAARNLDRIIDVNFYPLEPARRSNLRHRPVGIGVQGLADVFARLRLPFESVDAAAVNRRIFATIYHGALESSCETAERRAGLVAELMEAVDEGDTARTEAIRDLLKLNEYETFHPDYPGAYSTFAGSPASQGQLQFDLWGLDAEAAQADLGPEFCWADLKARIALHGLRNSLLTAVMPTASTSQIGGNNECIEPFTSNIYARKTLAGSFTVINKYLVADLAARGLWTPRVRDEIVLGRGSVAAAAGVPADLRALYKTVWEIKQRDLIDKSADRAPYVDQSQSLNLYVLEPNLSRISNMHFYAWERGLKTGCYYLRVPPKSFAQQFTVAPELSRDKQTKPEPDEPVVVCRREAGCVSCGA